jgi:hypothetical protein
VVSGHTHDAWVKELARVRLDHSGANAILQPLMPTSNIVRLLWEGYGIVITIRGVYNWRANGVSDECSQPLAELRGIPVEDVLRASGKI